MAKRRGNKEGSIYLHKPSGKWCAQATLQSQRLTKYFDTQKECREWLKEIHSQIDQGLTYTAANLSLGNYLTDWLVNTKATLKPNTYYQYNHWVQNHILPEIGNIKLKDLRPDHIQRLYSKKLNSGVSPRSVRYIHAVLRKALNQAVVWGLIGRNPIKAIKPPKNPKKEMQYYDLAQVKILLNAVEETRYAALYQIAITTGMRQGEILGLQWPDIDWDNKYIQVKRQLQRIKGQGLLFTTPKSNRSKRVIAIGNFTIKKLKEHQTIIEYEKLFAGDRWLENDIVFPSTIGTPMEPRNLTRHFKNLINELGLPEIRFHDLRHTAATLMFKQGVHPKVVQERLGHSSISLTLDTYSHVIPSLQEEAATLLETLISNDLQVNNRNT